MPLRIIKAARIRVILINTGAPSILTGMNNHGVTGARLGKLDLQVPFGTSFDLPLPSANVTFAASPGALVSAGVWAFPLHGLTTGQGTGGFQPSKFLQFRKPKYPKGG